MATSLCIPASWVLADSFDAVTAHEPMPIDFWEDEPEVSLITCPCCEGEGYVLALHGDYDILQPCERCKGSGEF